MTGLHLDSTLTDAAAGVHDQDSFAQRVRTELASQVQPDAPISILRFDVDGFERLNGSYGRVVGDAVLRVVVESARRILQPDGVLARCGAEAFAIFMCGVSARNASIFAERLCRCVNSLPLTAEGRKFGVTISVGVATSLKRQCETPSMLIAAAERALTVAKSSGGNRVSSVSCSAPSTKDKRTALSRSAS